MFLNARSMHNFMNSPSGAIYGFAPIPFEHSILSGVPRSPAYANFQGASLRSAMLGGALLDFSHLQGVLLELAVFQGASLKYASLQGASLEGADLRAASLDHAQLQGASLDHAQATRERDISAAAPRMRGVKSTCQDLAGLNSTRPTALSAIGTSFASRWRETLDRPFRFTGPISATSRTKREWSCPSMSDVCRNKNPPPMFSTTWKHEVS